MIDTHCHLYAPPLGAAVPENLAHARRVGVERFVVPGTTLDTSRAAVALAERHPDVFAAVGVHPEAADLPFDPGALVALARHPAVVAIGEVGLDRSPESPPLATQERVLRAQIQIARDLGLPLLLHSRDATGRLLRLLQETAPDGPGGILHAWAGAPEVARQLAPLGFRFGVSGVVTWPAARRVRARIAALPLPWLVLETDAPYIGTASVRRGAVTPAALAEVCAGLANLLGVPADTVARATSETSASVLRLPPSPHDGEGR